jgi:hypothetical protein
LKRKRAIVYIVSRRAEYKILLSAFYFMQIGKEKLRELKGLRVKLIK